MRWLAVLCGLLIGWGGVAQACGADSDCRIGERIYRISLPEGTDPPVGAVVWSHGYRGSAAGVMRNMSLRRMVNDRGMALIAAEGVGGSWDLPNGPRTMDSTGAAEFAYFERVIADATARFGIAPDRLVATGFSAGGMMVWNLACARPALFAGFVPFSGTYWQGPPETCARPASSVVHIHGTGDGTVPLDGRAIGPTRQGRVSDAVAHYAAHGAFGGFEISVEGPLRCRTAQNAGGERLELCLFDGGHSFRTEFLTYGLDRLEDAGKL
ncbi:prolyl oligopeptidase family serine peptidase [Sulfitobacter sp. HNIBRBA3233]|uniref:alpha/beta hydrolase family esterase n=1 Tax=Sulfitobacter marinivivus TaxID=3158558 RepID=UPI0032E02287